MKTSMYSANALAKSIFLFSFLVLNATAFSQDTLKARATVEASVSNHVSNNMWYYFKLSDTIAVKVIDHLPVPASLGLRSGSMTIVETQRGEVIRIIDPVNDANHYKRGQTIKVAPASKPSFDLSTAVSVNDNTGRPTRNSFDLGVRKTTWGNIVTN